MYLHMYIYEGFSQTLKHTSRILYTLSRAAILTRPSDEFSLRETDFSPFSCPPNDITTVHVIVSEMDRYVTE